MVVPPVAVPAAVAVDPRHDDRCISPIGYEFGLLLDLLKAVYILLYGSRFYGFTWKKVNNLRNDITQGLGRFIYSDRLAIVMEIAIKSFVHFCACVFTVVTKSGVQSFWRL